MKLYMTPFACSQAPHIALNEAGLAHETVLVDIPTRRTASGDDFTKVNRKGYVPALALDDGEILTENVAILAWIAEQAPALVPPGPLGRIRMIELIGFLTEEVHKPFLILMFWPGEEAKAASREALDERFAHLAATLKGDYALGDAFSAADAMLFVMLNWAHQQEMRLDPRLLAYMRRVAARPAVARTLALEQKAAAG